MKIMIASDIHGSAFFCEKMIEAYKEEKADKLLLLGDLLYHGPRNDLPEEYSPKRTAELLNGIKDEVLCVRGNCEADVDQMVLDFPVLAEYCMIYDDGVTIFAAHGHNFNTENIPPLKTKDILLNGHTHIPKYEYFGRESGREYIYVNPGSVSIPKDGSANSYVIFENCSFTWKTLDGTGYMKLKL